MDEIQIANTTGKTISKIFQESNLYDINYLYEKNIKIVQFSATPDGCYYDLKQWNECNYKIVIGEIDNKYVSAIDIYNDKRIFQSKPLVLNNKNTNPEEHKKISINIEEIKNILEERFNEPSYIIIRASTNQDEYVNTISNIKSIFPEKLFNYVKYDQELKQDINVLVLNNKPDKTTFIIIKEKLRVAYTINQKYISILYDRYVKVPNDSVIIQSLLGRATGYNHNHNIIIFTNISSITKYHDLLKSEFNNINVNWSSNSTTKINGELIGKNTFNSVDNFNDKVNKMNLHDYFDIPLYISITKKEMDNILNTKPYNYDQSKIFSIIKSYNIDIYNKVICNFLS
jgi:hypothetical protein